MLKLNLMSVLVAWIAATCGAGTVDESTFINESHACSGSRISFVDGINGPIEATIGTGGVADGISGNEGSRIVLDGGTITSRITLNDTSHLTLRSGSYGCTSSSCEAIDFDLFTLLRDDSSLHIVGGIGVNNGVDSISLNGNSKVYFSGRGLTLELVEQNTFDRYLVTGSLQNGSPLRVIVELAGDTDGRIILNEIPEPSSFLLLCIALFRLGLTRIASPI